MKNERLLVVPLTIPGNERREEINRAISFQLYEMLGDKITFLDFDEEYDLYKYIVGEPDLIKDCNWYCKGYKELKERHMEILSCVDNVLIYGMQVRDGITNGRYGRFLPKMYNIEIIKTELNKCHRKDDYGFVNVGTRKKLKNILSRMVFLECLGESDVNVFHYQVDPREVDLSPIIGKDRYHIIGALKSTVGPRRSMPFFEWGLKNTYIQEIDKYMDFFYYVSVISEQNYGRAELRDITKKFNNCVSRRKPNKGAFSNSLKGFASVINDLYKKGNDALSQSEYYYKIMISRYTFVNLPFMRTEFNYQRFMESIILGCIPFVDNRMNLDDLRLTYPEFYDIIIKEKLLIDTQEESYSDIATRMKKYSENGDTEIINKFKSTKAYQALMDKDKIRECWRKKLRWKDV